jgi:hypothetical protein
MQRENKLWQTDSGSSNSILADSRSICAIPLHHLADAPAGLICHAVQNVQFNC